jgi:hypothetical protein
MAVRQEMLNTTLMGGDFDPREKFEINVGSFRQKIEAGVLWEFFRLLMINNTWVPRTEHNRRDFLSNEDALGRLNWPIFYQRDLRDAVLPQFLAGESGKAMLGIQNLEFSERPNEYSYRNHKRTYGEKKNGYYYEWSKSSLADTFYESDLELFIAGENVSFQLREFKGDMRENGERGDSHVDLMRKGDIYEAIFLLAATPDAAWKVIWENAGYLVLREYILWKNKSGIVIVKPYDHSHDGDIANWKDDLIDVRVRRVGMDSVRAGRLVGY